MNIRPAGIKDLDRVSYIESSCFEAERYPREMLEEILAREGFLTFIAEEGEVLGAVTVHYAGEEAQLVSLAVLPGFRNRGVASALLRTAEDAARDLGAREMVLQVRTLNVPAMNLYLHRGYVLAGIIRNYYGYRKDAFFMRRAL
ncbi:GNAT family N-acetyltransferase [Methanomassiliicoccus luminyensis]|uniref:GNAT family N-acetyltransferase n=1 Tax=Methanomassiliicoccus luminyensis TaxID=1080712 RepID=UPI00036FB9B2|nr:N-acetyltransferase [Methanomassiliicoccus luminyensis]